MSSMQMPSSGTGLRFRLLGVPVTIGPSIVLLLALFGFNLGDVVAIVLWVLIGIASIVLHELGHALVARAAGAEPEITLAGLGGVTRYQPTGRSGTRGWRIAISLAGPAVGLAIGGIAWLFTDSVDRGYSAVALQILLFTSIGWSVFNLLPILPLDGGQALRELLSGDDRTRTVRAAWTGVVTSVLLGLAAVLYDQVFIMLFSGLFAMQNYRIATAERTARRDHDELVTRLRERDFRAVRDALAEGRGDHAIAEAAQVGAADHGEHQLAAEIGEVVVRRGTDDPRFAQRSAAAWRALGMDDRATRLEADGEGPTGHE